MKSLFTAITLTMLLTGITYAQGVSDTALHDWQHEDMRSMKQNEALTVEQLKKRTDGMVARDESVRKRVEVLESFVEAKAKQLAVANYKIDELERKVAGMQKQITILHAKKQDK